MGSVAFRVPEAIDWDCAKCCQVTSGESSYVNVIVIVAKTETRQRRVYQSLLPQVLAAAAVADCATHGRTDACGCCYDVEERRRPTNNRLVAWRGCQGCATRHHAYLSLSASSAFNHSSARACLALSFFHLQNIKHIVTSALSRSSPFKRRDKTATIPPLPSSPLKKTANMPFTAS